MKPGEDFDQWIDSVHPGWREKNAESAHYYALRMVWLAAADKYKSTHEIVPSIVIEEMKGRMNILRDALAQIRSWKLPSSYYEYDYGSSGAREYFRKLADQALVKSYGD